MMKVVFGKKTDIKKGADMKKVLQIDKKSKVSKARVADVKTAEEYGAMEVDSRLALIQALIPLGLMHIKEELQAEVVQLAGERYKRNGIAGYSRWGSQKGSIYVQDQRIPMLIPRVRDTKNKREVSLSTYERLQSPAQADEGLLRRVLHGLSCRDYKACAEAVPEALSLSSSSVSRRYVKASSRKLRELMERPLEGYDFVAIVLDGKTFGEDEIIMAVGVTIDGKKVILGIIQSGSENHRVCGDFLRELIDRGLKYDKGLLVVIDGAKGIKKAIAEVFGPYGIVQRCQWHKRENVVSYLPKNLQGEFRRKMQAAYEKGTYDKTRAALQHIRKELQLINESAVRSLEEGLEETLTVHRLGIHSVLRRSFMTTNMIESINAQVEQRTQRIDYWKNSSQKQRWVATALLFIEHRLHRVKGYRHLRELRIALQREIKTSGKQIQQKEAVAA